MWTASTVVLVLLPLVASAFSTVYDDSYARVLVKVNGAAYSSDPSTCIKNIDGLSSDWKVIKRNEIDCSALIGLLNATCANIILRNDVEKQYIISYRGTVGDAQLIAQFINANLVSYGLNGYVNMYFKNAFNGLWPLTKTEIVNAKKDGYSIVVTGFSLGGALATLTAFNVVDMGYQTSENTYLLTFGSPRVGNPDFALKVNKLLPYAHRVVNKADLVPHIPPCTPLLGLKTCLSIFPIGYYHSQQEIWYEYGSGNGANYTTTTRFEDPRGSNQLGYNRELKDHIAYFGLNLETYGATNKCVG